jgi:hypothetical protein
MTPVDAASRASGGAPLAARPFFIDGSWLASKTNHAKLQLHSPMSESDHLASSFACRAADGALRGRGHMLRLEAEMLSDGSPDRPGSHDGNGGAERG